MVSMGEVIPEPPGIVFPGLGNNREQVLHGNRQVYPAEGGIALNLQDANVGQVDKGQEHPPVIQFPQPEGWAIMVDTYYVPPSHRPRQAASTAPMVRQGSQPQPDPWGGPSARARTSKWALSLPAA